MAAPRPFQLLHARQQQHTQSPEAGSKPTHLHPSKLHTCPAAGAGAPINALSPALPNFYTPHPTHPNLSTCTPSISAPVPQQAKQVHQIIYLGGALPQPQPSTHPNLSTSTPSISPTCPAAGEAGPSEHLSWRSSATPRRRHPHFSRQRRPRRRPRRAPRLRRVGRGGRARCRGERLARAAGPGMG